MERGLSRRAAPLATVLRKDLLRQRLTEFPNRTEEEHRMELLLALGVVYVVAHLIYRNGKREGSKKAFRVGWDRGRRGRGRRRR